MSKLSHQEYTPAIAISSCGEASAQIADIIARMNAIGDNPLQRIEMEQLRRTYAAAVVRYFDDRQKKGK
jgi:hypothetical protein